MSDFSNTPNRSGLEPELGEYLEKQKQERVLSQN